MSIQGIDFSKLTLQDALDLAILIEDEAKERYDEFADQMEIHHTPEAATFFRLMSKYEAKHGEELTERRVRLFKNASCHVSRAMLFDVEAPEYDEARAFMTPRQAMTSALHAEEKAYAFFAAALPQIKDADVKALFEELKEEEVEHQDMVKRELARLAPDAALSAEDVADEPTAQ